MRKGHDPWLFAPMLDWNLNSVHFRLTAVTERNGKLNKPVFSPHIVFILSNCLPILKTSYVTHVTLMIKLDNYNSEKLRFLLYFHTHSQFCQQYKNELTYIMLCVKIFKLGNNERGYRRLLKWLPDTTTANWTQFLVSDDLHWVVNTEKVDLLIVLWIEHYNF